MLYLGHAFSLPGLFTERKHAALSEYKIRQQDGSTLSTTICPETLDEDRNAVNLTRVGTSMDVVLRKHKR